MDGTDERSHLEQMRRSLASAPASVASLGRLIAEMESLCTVLLGVSDEWKDTFQAEWGTLEEVFAVALDRELEMLDEEGTTLVSNAMEAMRTLVDDALRAMPPIVES